MHCREAYFVTGTDTEVGKTFATCTLLHAARQKGYRAIGMKPVASGVDHKGRNSDVEKLIAASSYAAPRELVNPYCFEAPIAPHIASVIENRPIEIERIAAAARDLASEADILLVEGVGGFLVPLGEHIDAADLAERLNYSIILVVGLRLGCLNHARLTVEAIHARGLGLAGWIANCIDPDMSCPEENISTLTDMLPAPLLGVLQWQKNADPAVAARYLSLP
jgi:dethiobiotin synthetase